VVEGIHEFAIDGEPGRREFITPLGGVVAGGGDGPAISSSA
jgi:hypothetical protein